MTGRKRKGYLNSTTPTPSSNVPPPLRMTTPGSPSYVASENARVAWAEKHHGRIRNTQSISFRTPGSGQGMEMSTFAEEAAKARAAAEKLAAAEKDPIEDENEGSEDGRGADDVPSPMSSLGNILVPDTPLQRVEAQDHSPPTLSNNLTQSHASGGVNSQPATPNNAAASNAETATPPNVQSPPPSYSTSQQHTRPQPSHVPTISSASTATATVKPSVLELAGISADKLDIFKSVQPMLDETSVGLASKIQELEEYKLVTMNWPLTQVGFIPEMRDLELEFVADIKTSMRKDGIDRWKPNNHMSGCIPDLNEIPKDGIWPRVVDLLLWDGLHRTVALTQIVYEDMASNPSIVNEYYWPIQIYKADLLKDELLLAYAMMSHNEPTNPHKESLFRKLELYDKYKHRRDVFTLIGGSLNNPLMIRSLSILDSVPSANLVPLILHLCRNSGFHHSLTTTFLERLAKDRLFHLSKLLLKEFILWHHQLSLYSDDGMPFASAEFFAKHKGKYQWPGTERKGTDFNRLAQNMNSVSEIVDPEYRDQYPAILGDVYVAKDVMYTATLATAITSELHRILTTTDTVLDRSVQFLYGNKIHGEMRSRAGGLTLVHKSPEFMFIAFGFMEKYHSGNFVPPSSSFPSIGNLPNFLDMSSVRDTIYEEMKPFTHKMYFFLLSRLPNGLTRVESMVAEFLKSESEASSTRGNKAHVIDALLTRSLDWFEWFLLLAGRPGFTFNFGTRKRIPAKSPSIVNSHRRIVLDGYNEDFESEVRAAQAGVEANSLREKIAQRKEQRDKLKLDFGNKFRQERAELREKHLRGNVGTPELDAEIADLESQLERVQDAVDHGRLDYQPITLGTQAQESLQERLDTLREDHERDCPSPPHEPPSIEDAHRIINHRVIQHEPHQIDSFVETMRTAPGFEVAFEGMEKQVIQLLGLLKKPYIAKLLISERIARGLEQALTDQLDFDKALDFLKAPGAIASSSSSTSAPRSNINRPSGSKRRTADSVITAHPTDAGPSHITQDSNESSNPRTPKRARKTQTRGDNGTSSRRKGKGKEKENYPSNYYIDDIADEE